MLSIFYKNNNAELSAHIERAEKRLIRSLKVSRMLMEYSQRLADRASSLEEEVDDLAQEILKRDQVILELRQENQRLREENARLIGVNKETDAELEALRKVLDKGGEPDMEELRLRVVELAAQNDSLRMANFELQQRQESFSNWFSLVYSSIAARVSTIAYSVFALAGQLKGGLF